MANVKKDKENIKFVITEEIAKQPEYAILGEFRFDPRLTDGSKILLAEIILLSNTKGYCYMSNSKLAKLFNKSVRTIQNYIEELVKFGYLLSETIRNDKKVVEERQLTPTKESTKNLPKKKNDDNKVSDLPKVKINNGELEILFCNLFGKEPMNAQAESINKMENEYGAEVVSKSLEKVAVKLKNMSGFGKYLKRTCESKLKKIERERERNERFNSLHENGETKQIPNEYYYDWMNEDLEEIIEVPVQEPTNIYEIPTEQKMDKSTKKIGGEYGMPIWSVGGSM